MAVPSLLNYSAEPDITGPEAMEFSVIHRQPTSVPKIAKIEYVNKHMVLLKLDHLYDAVAGSLGVEQKKRLTVGVELGTRPDRFLFLDEPTSGLDSQSAFSIVRILKRLSQAGQAIICAIHQPSSILIQQFDMIFALNPGGNTFYFGPVGENAARVVLSVPLDKLEATWSRRSEEHIDRLLNVFQESKDKLFKRSQEGRARIRNHFQGQLKSFSQEDSVLLKDFDAHQKRQGVKAEELILQNRALWNATLEAKTERMKLERKLNVLGALERIVYQAKLQKKVPPTAGIQQGLGTSYGANFLETATGYLTNRSAASECAYGPCSVADECLHTMETPIGCKWKYFGAFGAMTITNWMLLYVFVYTVRIRGWTFGMVPLFRWIGFGINFPMWVAEKSMK
ncbi:hypothetical protein B9Z19DRAFT_1142917 [Tuber borchii]|uniref:P-loop containing nucleoside triphosphate hydrolase protein n=1 Tax=Tuber borchii TaxID=42251 RepID=A0A2T6ZS64_TUBBO|nr:hypothetical protein B9Z19DRAFT_1142917 [Tuber borchii]